MVKVVNVSLHRSATQSFVEYGNRLGLAVCHWPGLYFDAVCEPALESLDTQLVFERYVPFLSRYDVFADLPVPLIGDRLMAHCPQATFVLVLRSVRDWISSVRHHLRERELDVLERLLYWRLCDRRLPRISDYTDAELDMAYRRHLVAVSRAATLHHSELHMVNLEDLKTPDALQSVFGGRNDVVFPRIDVNTRLAPDA